MNDPARIQCCGQIGMGPRSNGGVEQRIESIAMRKAQAIIFGKADTALGFDRRDRVFQF